MEGQNVKMLRMLHRELEVDWIGWWCTEHLTVLKSKVDGLLHLQRAMNIGYLYTVTVVYTELDISLKICQLPQGVTVRWQFHSW